MGRHAAQQPIHPLVVAQHGTVVIVEPVATLLHQIKDVLALVLFGEADPAPEHLVNRLVTAFTGKDEKNRGEKVFIAQLLYDIGAINLVAFILVALVTRGAASTGAVPTPTTEHLCGLHHFGVHCGISVGRGKERQELMREHHVLMKRNRSFFAHDDIGMAADRVQPISKLFRVGDRRAQRNNLDTGG